MKLSELTLGDRFLVTHEATKNGPSSRSLWTFIDLQIFENRQIIICRKHSKHSVHPGTLDSICHFELDQEVEFVPPKELELTNG